MIQPVTVHCADIIIIIALQNAQRGKKIEIWLAVISSDEASAD